MNLRQKKKRCKKRVADFATMCFKHKARTKHVRLLGVLSEGGYIYQHDGYSIQVRAYEKEEQKNGEEQSHLCPET